MSVITPPRIVRMPTDEETREAFERYVMAVGKVAHAWNYLQDKLGQLFAEASGIEINMAYTIWHSILSDKAQREMLRACLTRSNHPAWPKKPNPKEDVIRIINEADKISEKRNIAVHTPASLHVGAAEDGPPEMGPSWMTSNPKAFKLLGKKLLAEFSWYEMSAETLSLYTHRITTALRFSDRYAWPDRPLMPTLGKKSVLRDPGSRRRDAK